MNGMRKARVVLAATAVVSGFTLTAPANAAPIYPMIVVTVTGRAGVTPSFTITAQSPTWTCVQGTWSAGSYVVECTPPTPPAGFTNTCLNTAVSVTSGGIPGAGALYGQTHCDDDPGSAASTPTGSSAVDADVPNVEFTKGYCEVHGGPAEPAKRPWTVTCTIDH